MTSTDRDAAKARVRAKLDARHQMPAREYIASLLHATRTHAEAEAMLAEVEREAAAKALSDAVETARGEYLTDATGDETDDAYNRGVADVIAAIDQFKA